MKAHKLPTVDQCFQRDSAYWGERGAWLVAYTMHRDSDTITRSNWRVLLKRFGGESESVAIERASHWAVGWIDRLVIHPDAARLIEIAEEARKAIDGYPPLDENDWSELEQDDADQTWRNCYSPSERVEYIREHRRDFDFRGFADLLGCVRGNYFGGNAGEFLS